VAQPVPPFRLASVDVFRGLTMAAMVIVNTPGDWSHVYPPLLHADWHGWTPTDLIFPFFVFIVGVSIVLSNRSAGSFGTIARRAALLYAFGLFLALYPTFNFATVRVMGVLARLALCYFSAALVFRAVAARPDPVRLRTVLAAAGALLVGYWALLTFVPVPGGTAGDLSPSGNLGAWLDRTVIGEPHLWRQSKTWDPEGLLSTLPAIATALTGVAAGIVLRSSRRTVDKMLLLAGAGLVAVVAGWPGAPGFRSTRICGPAPMCCSPADWRASRSRSATGPWTAITRKRWCRPLIVLGTNALALFVLSGLLVKTSS
jgi:predicted acyltransferase